MWVSELRGEYIGRWVGRFRRTEVGGSLYRCIETDLCAMYFN